MNRFSLTRITQAMLVSALVLVWATPSFAQVSVSLPDTTMGDAGTTGVIPVTVSDLTDSSVVAYSFVISFDQSVVQITGASVDGTISEGLSFEQNATDSTFALALAAATPLEGEGTLVNLNVSFVAEGTSDLTFTSFELNEGEPAVETTDGTVVVGEGPPPPPPPGGACVGDGTPGDPLQIPAVAGAPMVDGVVDLVWTTQGCTVAIATLVNGTAPDDDADLSGTAHVMYDKGHLYVLYDVNDSELRNNSTDSWQDDAVDLYIDPFNRKTFQGRDPSDAQFEFSWGDAGHNVTGGTQGHAERVVYRWTTKAAAGDTTGYIVEAKVPWFNFGFEPQGRNELIGIEFMINDDDPPTADRDAKLAWFSEEGVDEAWQWSHVLGTAMLTGDPVQSGDPFSPLEIPFTSTAPTINGTREAAWNNGVTVELNKLASGSVSDTSDLFVQVTAMFDWTNLYVFYDVDDDQLVYDAGADTWQDDTVDLYIDGGNEKARSTYDANDAQFEFRWGDPNRNVTGNAGGGPLAQGVMYEVMTKVENGDTTGYTIEAVVPWANFGIQPYWDTIIGLEFKINEDDPPGGNTRDAKMTWYEDGDDAWQWAHVMGTARLVGGRGVDTEGTAELPERFEIHSVYPNPFNPSTTAIVHVREIGDYDVRIYNVLGQQVDVRRVQAQVPGVMEVSLDFGRYASGLYMISIENLQTGTVATAKAMFLK